MSPLLMWQAMASRPPRHLRGTHLTSGPNLKIFGFFCPFILINFALFSLSHTCSHSENTFCSLPYSLFHSTTQKYNNTFPICKAFAFNPPNFRTFYFHFLDLKTYLLAGSIIEDLFINSHLPEQKVCRNVLPHFY